MKIGIDLTACWRPRVGMVTVALDLTRALLVAAPDVEWTLFCSRERVPALADAQARFLLSPYRHEVANKLTWLPAAEAAAGLDAVFYPYWPSPPRRRAQAPPAVVFVHDLAFKLRPREVPWQQRVYQGALFPRALPCAAAVIVPSAATRDDLLAAYRSLEPERVHVVPEAAATLGAEARPLRDGLQPGFLLAVGTVEPRKNYPRLVRAYRRLENPPHLVVAGREGWAYGDAMDMLRSTPGIQLLGHVSDAELLGLYRNAVALAFPSLYEGFGLPLLEAMREGLPALIGNRGALPELAGEAALAVDAEDEAAIAHGLQRLLDEPDLRARLAQAGRRRAAGFSWPRAAQQTLEILRGANLTG
ncbi:MAG TPA: glycosyltransferase family 1 protein [Candidatus Dormibacteraeota bacterium]